MRTLNKFNSIMKRENQIKRSIEKAKHIGATDEQMDKLKALLPVRETEEATEIKKTINIERINKHLRDNVTFEGNHYLMMAYVGECLMFTINENAEKLLSISFNDGIYKPISRAELSKFPHFENAWGVQEISTSK